MKTVWRCFRFRSLTDAFVEWRRDVSLGRGRKQPRKCTMIEFNTTVLLKFYYTTVISSSTWKRHFYHCNVNETLSSWRYSEDWFKIRLRGKHWKHNRRRTNIPQCLKYSRTCCETKYDRMHSAANGKYFTILIFWDELGTTRKIKNESCGLLSIYILILKESRILNFMII